MFDDHTPQGGGTVPPNLPFGEPEDIFAGVEAPASPLAPSSDESAAPGAPPVAAPAPLETTSALSAGVLRP